MVRPKSSGQRPKFDLLQELRAAGYTTTGNMTFDLATFAEACAGRIADQIRANLVAGLKPTGRGAMPLGKVDKTRPRGQGTAVAASIRAVEWQSGTWKVLGEDRVPGMLRRVLKGCRLRLPKNAPDLMRAALKDMLDEGKANG